MGEKATTLNTPEPNYFGGPPADPPSDGMTHKSTERPADAGHVYSVDDEEYDKRTGGIPEGTPMAFTENPDAPKAISASEARKNAKATTTGTISTVGKPDQTTAELERQVAIAPAAVATDADNTPGARPYTREGKEQAKDRIKKA